jgi:hypothetical protein
MYRKAFILAILLLALTLVACDAGVSVQNSQPAAAITPTGRAAPTSQSVPQVTATSANAATDNGDEACATPDNITITGPHGSVNINESCATPGGVDINGSGGNINVGPGGVDINGSGGNINIGPGGDVNINGSCPTPGNDGLSISESDGSTNIAVVSCPTPTSLVNGLGMTVSANDGHGVNISRADNQAHIQ